MKTATATDVIAGNAAWSVDCADALEWLRGLPDDCIHCAVTSPPYYGLRDYGCAGQIGLEDTPSEYVARLVDVFRELRRALHPSGMLWLNLGDSFARMQENNVPQSKNPNVNPPAATGRVKNAGLKAKDLIGIPWQVAFALRADGWYLRQHCPWVKRNPMPESVTDRPGTGCEEVFLLAKRSDYYFDMEAVKRCAATEPHAPGNRKLDDSRNDHDQMQKVWGEDGSRNFRNSDLWFDSVGMLLAGEHLDPELLGFDVTTQPYKGAHFAVMPRKLIEPMVLAGTSGRGVCPTCGEPWTRTVKRERKPTRPGRESKVPMSAKNQQREEAGMQSERSTLASIAGNRDPQRHCTTTETTGWERGCKCPEAEPVPAVVCDPFTGSGTVASVAVGLGLRFIGSELNTAYVKLIHRRMSAITASMFTEADA